MPDFAKPFIENMHRKMTKEELIQAIRLDIAAELEAIYLYDAHFYATENEFARKVLGDIRDEEKTHIGELMTLLRHLNPEEAELFIDGEEEVKEMMDDLGIRENSSPGSTVGSLLK